MKLRKRDVEQLNYLKDFDINISFIGKSEYLIVKVGKTSDLDILKNKIRGIDKTAIYSKQYGKGKDKEWAVVIVAYISEREKIPFSYSLLLPFL